MAATEPILRFAPSPNGPLHLGHAYSALFTQRTAQRLGGTFLLRIEDIDTERSRPEHVAAIFDDLSWLGLSWPESVLYQSSRFSAYRTAAAQLQDKHLLYPCFCSRAEIADRAGATDPDGAPLYDGACRDLDPESASMRRESGEQANWRLDSAAALAATGDLTFSVFGIGPDEAPEQRRAAPERWGDPIIVRKHTPTSYHLSVVVDDAHQSITHVTRGQDLEACTDIHRLLQALLDLPVPAYHFHRLITGPDGAKLAKSAGSTSLADLRASGWTAQQVRRELGFV